MHAGLTEGSEVERSERDLLALHGAFTVVVVIALALPGELGPRALAAVVVYQLGLVGLALARRDRTLLRLWWFATTLSVWQVLPDWFLVEGLGTLHFPPDGLPDIGPVTAHMALIWAVPIVVVVGLATAVEQRRGRGPGLVAAAVCGAVVFVAAELLLPLLPVWEARNVATVGTLAVYLVPAEILLAVVAYDAFGSVRDRPAVTTIPVTLLIALLYTGAAAVGWLLVERIL